MLEIPYSAGVLLLLLGGLILLGAVVGVAQFIKEKVREWMNSTKE